MVPDNAGGRVLGTLLLGVALAAGAVAITRTAEPADAPTFVTWSTLEPDKCASIWLIRRFVAADAHILFFAPATSAPAGIPFDTPDAALRRYHNASTFETLARHYRISAAEVAYVGRLMHDIEINTWEKKALPETLEIAAALADALARIGPDEAIDYCVDYFDRLTKGRSSGQR